MSTVRGEVSLNHINPFFTSTASGGSTTGASLVAGVTGSKIFVTDVIFSALTTCSITLREDTSTAAYLSVDMGFTAILGGASFSHSFIQPIILTVDKPLQYTATDKVKVSVSGYYG